MRGGSATVVRMKRVGSPEWRTSGASCAWLRRSRTRWGAACCSHPPGTCCRRRRRWDWGARCATAEYWCSTPSAGDTHPAVSNRRQPRRSHRRRWHLGNDAYRDAAEQVINRAAMGRLGLFCLGGMIKMPKHTYAEPLHLQMCPEERPGAARLSSSSLTHEWRRIIVAPVKESFPTALQGRRVAQDNGKSWEPCSVLRVTARWDILLNSYSANTTLWHLY